MRPITRFAYIACGVVSGVAGRAALDGNWTAAAACLFAGALVSAFARSTETTHAPEV